MSTETPSLPIVDSSFRTYTGKQFDVLNPNPELICIEDIAHALSNMCRYTGHCKFFYSVAHHSVLVSELVSPENALWGLLHDASEAYLVDVPRPLKYSPNFSAYRTYEYWMMQAVCKAFGLDPVEPKEVKKYDDWLLFTEMPQLTGRQPKESDRHPTLLPITIEKWTPEEAEERFMNRFRDTNRRSAVTINQRLRALRSLSKQRQRLPQNASRRYMAKVPSSGSVTR
jgi:5'-deoxynucleotidase YfbR-like HD superfamily hydrolase